MEWRKGDILEVAREEKCNVIAFTANAVLKKHQGEPALVMGAGAALRIREAFPGIDLSLGKHILRRSSRPEIQSGLQDDYHVIAEKRDGIWIAALQVKRHWKEDGDWDLTVNSLETLACHLAKYPDLKCVLNCPLIGLGGFANQKDDVMHMVSHALKHSNVIVCYM